MWYLQQSKVKENAKQVQFIYKKKEGDPDYTYEIVLKFGKRSVSDYDYDVKMHFNGDFILDSDDIPQLLGPFIAGFKIKDGINVDNSMKKFELPFIWEVNE